MFALTTDIYEKWIEMGLIKRGQDGISIKSMGSSIISSEEWEASRGN